METRAHHLLIGGFMIIMVVSLLMFILWLAKVDIDQEFAEYDIYFEESVAGLTKSSVVQYNGIPVGQVTVITIDPNDPKRVLVTVEIQSGIALYRDSVAVLAMQGVTGVAYVQIEGGSVTSGRLMPDEEGNNPVLQSRTSAIQELFSGAPDLINQAINTVGRINALLNDQNRTHVGNILANVDTLSANLARGTQDMDVMVAELRVAIASAQQAAETVQALATGDEASQLLGGGVGLLLDARKLLANLNGLVEDNRGAISGFTNGTLPEMSRLVVDVRRLAIALTSLAEKLENDPAGLIFSPAQPEYEPQ